MFHLQVKAVSRGEGRSAVAAAAYRSGTRLEELSSGDTHDYTRKRDIVHGEILLPAGAPVWAAERAGLWNGAEASEKRKNSVVARDYEVAIPKGLTREQGIDAVRDFAQALVDRYGVAIDFNVHKDDLRKWDGSEKGWQGYHAHVLATTRKLGPDGFGAKADSEISDTDRKARGLNNRSLEMVAIRELWEVTANRHLELAGSEQRIDRRSLAEQGIEREATIHLGPYVTELERRGVASDLGNLNRDILAGRKPQAEQIRVGHGSFHAQPEAALARDEELPAEPVDEVELRRLAADRVTWVVRVIERAERREERRERALGAQAGRPWDLAKAQAIKLLQQARALTKRLREALEPRRLLAWSEEQLRRVPGRAGQPGQAGKAAGGARPQVPAERIDPAGPLQMPSPFNPLEPSPTLDEIIQRKRAAFKAEREKLKQQRLAAPPTAAGKAPLRFDTSLQVEAAEIRRRREEALTQQQALEAERRAAEEARQREAAAARRQAELRAEVTRRLERDRQEQIERERRQGLDRGRSAGRSPTGGLLPPEPDKTRGRGGPER